MTQLWRSFYGLPFAQDAPGKLTIVDTVLGLYGRLLEAWRRPTIDTALDAYNLECLHLERLLTDHATRMDF